MPFYFAYGSNMNPRRVTERGLDYCWARSGWLDDMGLRFNKRSRHNPEWACANVVHSPGERVEGVLYRLAGEDQILHMDPFEGTPVYYSRERLVVQTGDGPIKSWVYIANPSVVAEDVLPLRWYLGQLLEGREYLSSDYYEWLRATECHPDESEGWR